MQLSVMKYFLISDLTAIDSNITGTIIIIKKRDYAVICNYFLAYIMLKMAIVNHMAMPTKTRCRKA